jgi:sodium/bile acid cotransporter 7
MPDRLKNFLKKRWFLIAIFAALALGISFPRLAELNPNSIISKNIIILLFLGIGMALPTESILPGLKNWKLHLTLQITIFLVTPALFFLAVQLFPFSEAAVSGILALSVLPTTVSTCIVFTQSAHGNTVGAMVNAAIANILGVFFSPLILSVLVSQSGVSVPMDVLVDVVTSLASRMILPLFIGQILHLIFRDFLVPKKKIIGNINNSLILFVVMLTIAKSAGSGEFVQALQEMTFPLLLTLALHPILVGFNIFTGYLLKFPPQDRITLMYAGSQKTLAVGVPVISAFFCL